MRKIVIVIALLSMVFGVTAFQCDTTEMTSARLYIQQNNYDKAKENLHKLLAKTENAEAYYLLGYIYGEQDSLEKMIDNFEKSLKVSKEFEAKVQESRTYHWAQNFNKGVALFNKAGAATGDSATIYYDKAIAAFDNAITSEPDSADTYKNLAFTYMNMGDTEKAVSPLKKLLELKPAPDTYVTLGQLYSEEASAKMKEYKAGGTAQDSVAAVEKYNEVISLMEKGRDLYPSNGDILMLLSNAYIATDKLDVAMDAFKAGVEKEPENKTYRYNYGVLLLNAEMYEEAVEQFSKAIDIDPDYTNAIYNYAVANVRWGADLRSEEEKMLEENPDAELPGLWKEKFQEALPKLEQYLEVKPDEPAVWDLLGRIYANLGMNEKSQKAFETADMYR